jgi:dTDP-4-dehydrorhamnose reductase
MVAPTTVHHKSKYEGEKIVQNHLSKYLILRTGWLYGGEKTYNKNFVYKRFLEASNKDIIYSDNTQIGNPTYVVDFVKQIKILIDSSQYGIFNCVNKAINISRYIYVKRIIELFELNCNVSIAPNGMFERIAPVSHNESAENKKLNLLSLNTMGDWENSLSKYIQLLRSEI